MTKQIYTTRDYDAFKTLVDNREVKGRTTRKIINSIEEVGYITNPIIVNENMEIIDGQNRLEALKQLNMPVDYIIVEGANVKHCRALNINQSNWTTLDWIKSYASGGNKSYQNLLRLIEEFPDMKVQVIAYSTNGMFNGVNANFVKGKFVCNDEEYANARKALTFLRQVVPYIRNIEGIAYMMECAVVWGFYDPEVDNDKLVEKIRKYWSMSRPIANFDMALEQLEAIYNFKSRNKVYIRTNNLKAKDGERLARRRAKDREHSKQTPQRRLAYQ